MYKFVIYEDQAGEWRWQLVSEVNGKVVADSGEGYSAKSGAKRAAEHIRDGIRGSMVRIEEGTRS